MSKITNLRELFIEELRDLYHAENQLVKALPKMAKAATHQTLRDGFEQHLQETVNQVQRLEQIFESLGEKPKGRTCEAMKGLIAEGDEWISQKAEPSLKDAGLIVAAQKIEHYEIAGYGSVRTFAERLGFDDIGATLQATLDEEAETDKQLTDICEALDLAAGELTGGTASERNRS
jgi:ferritin-like metal-binding protein YciE